MDAVLEEFCRVSGTLQIHVFRRMQRYFASELGPKIDRLEAENANLRELLAARPEIAVTIDGAEVARVLTEPDADGNSPLPAVIQKRGRGRPRKHPVQEPVGA